MELYVVISNLNSNSILGTYESMNHALECIEEDKDGREFFSYVVIVINTVEKTVYELNVSNC